MRFLQQRAEELQALMWGVTIAANSRLTRDHVYKMTTNKAV